MNTNDLDRLKAANPLEATRERGTEVLYQGGAGAPRASIDLAAQSRDFRERCLSIESGHPRYSTLDAEGKSRAFWDLGLTRARRAGVDVEHASAATLIPFIDEARRDLEGPMPGHEPKVEALRPSDLRGVYRLRTVKRGPAWTVDATRDGLTTIDRGDGTLRVALSVPSSAPAALWNTALAYRLDEALHYLVLDDAGSWFDYVQEGDAVTVADSGTWSVAG